VKLEFEIAATLRPYPEDLFGCSHQFKNVPSMLGRIAQSERPVVISVTLSDEVFADYRQPLSCNILDEAERSCHEKFDFGIGD